MSPRKAGGESVRFTLNLPEDKVAELERLQKKQGKSSLAEVVREAVEVYTSLMKARDKGVQLFFEDAKSSERGRIWLLPGPPPCTKR